MKQARQLNLPSLLSFLLLFCFSELLLLLSLLSVEGTGSHGRFFFFSFSFVAGVALVDDIVIVADYLVKVVVALIKLDGTHGGEIRRGDVAVDIALLASFIALRRSFACSLVSSGSATESLPSNAVTSSSSFASESAVANALMHWTETSIMHSAMKMLNDFLKFLIFVLLSLMFYID